MIRMHPFSAADEQIIEAAVRTYHSRIGSRINKMWFKHVDVNRVLTRILSGDLLAAIVDDSYLVVFTIGAPWYTDELVLEELGILTLGRGGDFAVVTRFLEDAAKANGCVMVAVGTALSRENEALARKYKRQGYLTEAYQLIKPITQE